jgi:hypothetical protein
MSLPLSADTIHTYITAERQFSQVRLFPWHPAAVFMVLPSSSDLIENYTTLERDVPIDIKACLDIADPPTVTKNYCTQKLSKTPITRPVDLVKNALAFEWCDFRGPSNANTLEPRYVLYLHTARRQMSLN